MNQIKEKFPSSPILLLDRGNFSDGSTYLTLGAFLHAEARPLMDPELGDLIGVNPMLGPLKDNGGATLTHALLPGSPAIDRPGSCLTTDQRGMPRPIDGDGDGIGDCDIGAVEDQVTIFYDGLEEGDETNWSVVRP